MHQRQAHDGGKILRKLAEIFLAGKNVQHRAERGAIQKTKHRVVELVIADADVIHVVRQAGDEFVAGGARRNFHQRQRMAQNQFAQKLDVPFQRGRGGKFRRLAGGQQDGEFPKTNQNRCARTAGRSPGRAGK